MNKMNEHQKHEPLDKEWVKLIIEAKNIGISPIEIQRYLHHVSSSNGK